MLNITVIILGNVIATRGQTLNKAICISLCIKTLWIRHEYICFPTSYK